MPWCRQKIDPPPADAGSPDAAVLTNLGTAVSPFHRVHVAPAGAPLPGLALAEVSDNDDPTAPLRLNGKIRTDDRAAI